MTTATTTPTTTADAPLPMGGCMRVEYRFSNADCPLAAKALKETSGTDWDAADQAFLGDLIQDAMGQRSQRAAAAYLEKHAIRAGANALVDRRGERRVAAIEWLMAIMYRAGPRAAADDDTAADA